jgi:hypothetical protein
MKKNPKKLRLHRDTLALMDPRSLSVPLGGAAAVVTSCTYPCDCPTGCTADQPCIDAGLLR